jgi:hypothetical protein
LRHACGTRALALEREDEFRDDTNKLHLRLCLPNLYAMRLVIAVFALSCVAFAQESEHMHHHDAMNARGEKAMGFSQTATTHHFTLLPDGGFVQVQANDPKDTANRDQIRTHLQQQAKRFSAGDFTAPELTHDRVPPGVDTMTRLKGSITYHYEEMERGGRLRIRSGDPLAVAAIHDFLKFQIEDHQTGDSTQVLPPGKP